MDQSCATKYPIMLIHGIGYQDNGSGGYWGRIPDILRSHGAELWFGNQDAFGTIEGNAAQLKISLQNALCQSGAEKMNLIAHSKGGIEARYLITHLDMAETVASLTTLATPHRGILSMDRMKERARPVYEGLVALFNRMLTVDGGGKNHSFKVYDQMTADYMQVFNLLVPDVKGVYYQSYAFDMKNAASDPAMSLFYGFVRRMEGPNDGLVSVESAKWGDFRGTYSGPGRCGISHPAAVDAGKRGIKTRKRGGGILDITDLYWDIACRLKALGY